MSGPTLPPMMPRFSRIIHLNLSTILTYVYSFCPLDQMMNAKFRGEWKFLRKTIVEDGTVKATQACIELAISLRALNEQEGIFQFEDHSHKFDLGTIALNGKSEPLIGIREFTNKVLHAKDLSWDFSDPNEPKLVCVPRNLEGWSRAEIDIVALAAYCGNLLH